MTSGMRLSFTRLVRPCFKQASVRCGVRSYDRLLTIRKIMHAVPLRMDVQGEASQYIYIRPGLSAYSKQSLPDRCCVDNIDNDGAASVCSHRDASMPSEERAYTSAGAPTTSESSSTDVDVSVTFHNFSASCWIDQQGNSVRESKNMVYERKHVKEEVRL